MKVSFSKLFKLINVLLLFAGSAFAQPCLNGWSYRTPIVVNNSNGSALANFQAKFVFNSQDLVVAGKAKADGGDIRVLDKLGNNLSFWIQNGTYNKPTTIIWVKLTSVNAAVIDSIYLFYGNKTSNNVSSGQSTFEFFDDFTGSFISPTRWNKCGGGNVTVAGGEVTLQSNNQASNAVISTKATFASPIVTEGFVNSVSEGIGFMGQINEADSGWAMAYEKLGSGNKIMRMIALRDSNTSLTCIQHEDQVPNPNTEVAGATSGIWKFDWHKDDTATVKWPGGSVTRMDTSMNSIYADPKHAVIGNLFNAGSLSIDWFRIRKHTDIEPILALGAELQTITTVTLGQNGPLCQDDTLRFSAPTFVGATYAWNGPNGYSSTDQNPKIGAINSVQTGQYLVTVTLPNGCAPVTGNTNVVVSDSSMIGTISGATTVCADTNKGFVSLSGQNGSMTHWQEGATKSGPWITLSDLDTFITYTNLAQSKYYRMIIKSGVCPSDTGIPAKVQVDQISLGGNLFGAAEVCRSHNGDVINLINQRGTIDKWQLSADTGKTWADITNPTNRLNYSNITRDQWYRLQVTNGVCATDTSDIVFINTFDVPSVRFATDTVCLGVVTQFSDSTLITDSKKSTWTWLFKQGQGSSLQHPSYQYLNAGTFSVQLKVLSSKGCIDSLTQSIVVNPGPTVAFNHLNVCDTLPIVYTNASSVSIGNIASYLWTFGDGDTAQMRDTNHYFPSDGNYTTQLKIVTDKGCSDSLSKAVELWPRTAISFDVDSVCLGKSILFNNRSVTTASSVAYNWTFGDGKSATLNQPTHTYASVDTFEVNLFSTTNKGCRDFATDTVVVFPLPKPDFTFSNECIYDTVRFTNKTNVQFGSLTYNWDFGNGFFSADTSPTYLYQVPNRYLIKLSVITDKGCAGDTSQWAETFAIPTANFEFKNVCDSFPMPFTNTSAIANGSLTYRWNYGDADTSVMEDPRHQYKTHGLYTVFMQTISEKNCKDSLTKVVQIYPRPVPSFTTDTVCFGIETNFINTTAIDTGKIDEYEWRYGDRVTSIDKQRDYLFLKHGIQNVNLRAVSDQNCIKDTTIEVLVEEEPLANFTVSDVCFKFDIEPINKSSISAGELTHLWRFGDAKIDSMENSVHRYEKSGIYELELVSTSAFGCKDSLKKFVETYKRPFVNAGADKTTSKGFEIGLDAVSDSGLYQWSPTLGLDDNGLMRPKANPEDTTLYTLQVTDRFGCQSSDSVTVHILPDYKLIIYNIITPDDNGENDVWYIDNAETYPDLHLWIYNKKGGEVYKSDGYKNDWTGSSGSDPLPDGSYYYVISFDNSERIYKGALTILRNL